MRGIIQTLSCSNAVISLILATEGCMELKSPARLKNEIFLLPASVPVSLAPYDGLLHSGIALALTRQ